MLIDTHTHFVPERLAVAIRRYFAEMGAPELAHPLDPPAALRDHVAAGAAAIWTLPYAHKPGMAAGLNAAMIDLAGRLTADLPLSVVPGCTVHPADEDPVADLSTAVEAGARVLKLHCSVGRYRPDDPGLAPALDAAGALRVPVVLHVGQSEQGTSTASDLAVLGAVADAHPDTTIIIAHCAHPATAEALDLMRRHANLWADLTPTITDTVAVDAESVTPVADRILLGSDTPNVAIRLPDLLSWLTGLGLASDAQEAMLHRNAARLVPL